MKIKEGGVMDIQKERKAFEAWVIENVAEGRSMSWGDWLWKAWQAAKAQAVQEGFVVVPKEPTEKMLNAARDWSADKYGKPVGNDGSRGCYQSMISAGENK